MSNLEKRLHSIAWWIATIYGIACSCVFLIALSGYILCQGTDSDALVFIGRIVSFWLGIPLLIFLLLQRISIGPIKRAPNTFTLVYVIATIVLTLVVYPIVFTDDYLWLIEGVNTPPLICVFLMFGMNYLKTRELDAASNSSPDTAANAAGKVSAKRAAARVVCVLIYLIAQAIAACYSLDVLLDALSYTYLINPMALSMLTTEPLYTCILFPYLYRELLIAVFGSIPLLMMLFYGARKRDQRTSVSRKVIAILAAIALLPELITFIAIMIGIHPFILAKHGYRCAALILIVGLIPLQLKKSSETRQSQLCTDEQPDDGAHDNEPQQNAEDSDDNGKEADGLQDSQSQQNIKDGNT